MKNTVVIKLLSAKAVTGAVDGSSQVSTKLIYDF